MLFKGMNYQVQGQGEAILLLHGWGASSQTFASLIQQLSLDYKVFAIDFLGFGKSDNPLPNTTIFDYAYDILEFIKCVVCEKVVIVGHSFGGRVALILANEPLIKAVVLVDSAGLKPRFNLSKHLKVKRYKSLKKRVLQGKADKSKLEKFGSQDYKALDENMKQIFVNVVNQDLRNSAKAINKKTLIIFGKQDKETPVYMARKLHKFIKNSKLRLIAGGHYCFLDNQEQFCKELYNFLERVEE